MTTLEDTRDWDAQQFPILSIWISAADSDRGSYPAVWIEAVGGPKPFACFAWPQYPMLHWSWFVPDGAVRIWPTDD